MFASVLRPVAWLTAGLWVLATALAVSTCRDSAVSAAPPAELAKPLAASEADNPAVVPGLVKWHKSFDDAKTASLKSGKPVLLFHMMGQLDKQFC